LITGDETSKNNERTSNKNMNKQWRIQDKILGGLNFTAGSTFVFNLYPVSNASFLSSNGRTFMGLGGLISSSSSLSLYFSSFLHLFFSLTLPIFPLMH
jgi:hypothetical protein